MPPLPEPHRGRCCRWREAICLHADAADRCAGAVGVGVEALRWRPSRSERCCWEVQGALLLRWCMPLVVHAVEARAAVLEGFSQRAGVAAVVPLLPRWRNRSTSELSATGPRRRAGGSAAGLTEKRCVPNEIHAHRGRAGGGRWRSFVETLMMPGIDVAVGGGCWGRARTRCTRVAVGVGRQETTGTNRLRAAAGSTGCREADVPEGA